MFIYLQMIETDEHRSKFVQIYESYFGLMYHTAYQILRHREDTEDAIHLAFVCIAEHIDTIDPPGARSKRYVTTIAENKAIDLLRKRNRHHTEPLTEDIPVFTMELDNDNHLVNCILKLPSLQRQVIWLKYHHGYSLREISKMLNRSLAWAIKTDQRAKAKLKQLYLEGEDNHVHR